MPSIRTFRIFLAVARHGTFAAAGHEVGLTPAAVGLQMRALEQALGQRLFHRGGRAIALAAAGRAAASRIEEIVLRYDELARARGEDPLSGSVAMGALVSALMGAFADALWTIKREHPRLEVKLFAGQSSDFAYKVDHGVLDAAIVLRPPRPLATSMTWTPLYEEPMVLVVPRRPPFKLPREPLAALAQAPFIRFDRDTWTGLLVRDVLARCDVRVHEAMELNSVEAIVEIVRQGFGVSIVPRLANVDWARDQQLRVVPLPGIDVQRHVGLLERARHPRMRFTDAIKRYFGERRAAGGARRTTNRTARA